MAVAKTYMNCEQQGKPFMEGGKAYVYVIYRGRRKQVRWYTEAEWQKMYGRKYVARVSEADEPAENPAKRYLGFGDGGYITIFKGDQFEHNDFFKASVARYHRVWGWYVISTDEVPADLPEGIEPVRLEWSKITHANGQLRGDNEIKEYVDSLIYGESTSAHVGEVGERLDLKLTVKRAIKLEGAYGPSTMHVFEDELGNVFLWTTTAKTLTVDKKYLLRGTVKDHDVYRGTNQTILTRCKVLKELD